MTFEPSLLDLDVRPNDLDSLGHVNNAVALEYLEAGRWGWMDQHGLQRGATVVPVVTRIEAQYRREIRPQRVTVRTRLELDEGSGLEGSVYKVQFFQEILTKDRSETAIMAQVDVAFIDATSRTLTSLQDFLASSQLVQA